MTAAPPRVRTFMLTCAGRRSVWAGTMARWRATDWGDDPVVVRDPGTGRATPDHIATAAHRVLQLAADQDADYFLFLEDDLLFNLHIRHNLLRWPPIRDRRLWMGSLFNPGLPPVPRTTVADIRARRAVPIAPGGYWGGQGFVLSRAALDTALREWRTGTSQYYDPRLAEIAWRNGAEVLNHVPSLVQQIPIPSTWSDYAPPRAIDFDPFYRAE